MNLHVFLACFETYKLDFLIEKTFYASLRIALK